jgi:membrane peptidoglycan carboxypeptidase
LAKLAGALLATGILAAGFMLPYVGGLGLVARHEASRFLNTTCDLTETQPPQKTNIYARDGKTLIATIFSQDRVPVTLQQVPKYLQQALVSTEDRRFYSHHGVDMRGLIRSAISTGSGDTQGGSTLTMQYVKQVRYYQAGTDIAKQQAAISQNLSRKIEDAQCALYIENTEHESKDQILTNYLNIAFFGENAYGIETAAQTYFNKPVNRLTLPESALLVGLLRAPTEYDPFVNPTASLARRNQVIDNLVAVGDLTKSAATTYKAQPVHLATKSPPPVVEGCANAASPIANVQFFCDYTVNWLENVEGISDSELKTGGLRVITTLDPNIQDTVQQHLSASIPATSPMTAVIPVVAPKTGDILAMATSKTYGIPKGKDNTKTEQPVFTSDVAEGASTYKLFPLLTALGLGASPGWQLETPDTTKGYIPQNCAEDSATFNAPLYFYNKNETLATATAKSSNTFFVGMADQLMNCDLQPMVDLARKMGITSLNQPSGEGNQTIAQAIVNNQRAKQFVLGNVGTSPLEITGAYAAVANDGRYNAPAPVLSITDYTGKSIPVKRPGGVQVVPVQVARNAQQVLLGDTTGSGTSAQPFAQGWYSHNPSLVAGKTGTTVAVVNGQDTTQNASLWFVGMTPEMVATTALINFDHPNAPAAGLPGLSDPGTQAYGAYASGVWVGTVGSALGAQQWAWQSPTAIPNGVAVPNVLGLDMATAKARLLAAGFPMRQFDAANSVQCDSTEPYGTVGYYGPQIAAKGTAVTVCPSNSVSQQIYTAPPPKPTPTPTPSNTPTPPSHSRTPTPTPTPKPTKTKTPKPPH